MKLHSSSIDMNWNIILLLRSILYDGCLLVHITNPTRTIRVGLGWINISGRVEFISLNPNWIGSILDSWDKPSGWPERADLKIYIKYIKNLLVWMSLPEWYFARVRLQSITCFFLLFYLISFYYVSLFFIILFNFFYIFFFFSFYHFYIYTCFFLLFCLLQHYYIVIYIYFFYFF